MPLLFGMGDGSLYRHDLLGATLPLLHPAQDFFLGTDGFGGRETPARIVLLSGHKLELTGGNASLKPSANFRVSSASRAESACNVESVPPCPVFMAWSKS
jgi:hypothetical protein